jgi:serine/threonine protein kinase
MTERALTTTRNARRAQVVRALSEADQLLVDRLVKEMGSRWERGERVSVESLLAEHPELQSNVEAVMELVYEELCLRERHGQREPPERVLGRFPQWQAELRMLLDCHEAFHELMGEPDFPAPGESFGEFHLLSELGRGAEGRVYLAAQASLADRPVVLKLIRRRSAEHLSLARAQHTHIVPLYSIAEDTERGLKGLCMPYFGGASLGQVLDSLAEVSVSERTGRHVLEAIDRLQALRPVQLGRGGPARRVLERASYVQAIVWIGACLAEALQFAHDRGLVHLDVKPSNVLLAADGQPMLLDFHLAQPPLRRGAVNLTQLGGTAPYMAPEQIAALEAVKENRPLANPVSASADVYSLAVTLYEALGDMTSADENGRWRRLEEINRRAPVEIADVIHKCLSTDPGQRYADAGRLASDLRRYLNNQPLVGVANRSIVDRWRKWRRRRPFAMYYYLAFVAALTAAGYAGLRWSHSAPPPTERVVELLEAGREHTDAGRFQEATQSFQMGLALVEAARQESLAETFRGELRSLIARHASLQLREANDQLRTAIVDDSSSAAEWVRIASQYRQLWSNRTKLAERLRAGGNGRLANEARQDLLNLALLLSEAEFRAARGDKSANWSGIAQSARARSEVLDEAEMLVGPSVLLDLQRARVSNSGEIATTIQELTAGSGPAALSEWETTVVGRTLLVLGMPQDAEPWLAEAVERQPDSFWPHLYRGVCFERLGSHQAAVAELTACVAIDPLSATAFYHRGTAHVGAGVPQLAKYDFERAIELEPNHANARQALSRLKP